MQIDVPQRLQSSIKDKKIKKGSLTCDIICPFCKNDIFDVFASDLTNELENEIIDEFLKKHPLLSYEINRDKKDQLFLRGTLFDIPVTKKFYLPAIENSAYQNQKIVKVKCSNCNKEIILFDSTQDGYDAVISEIKDKTKNEIKFKLITKFPQKINIKIYNFETFEQFKEETGLKNVNDYYDGYGSIKITLINPKTNRKKVIFNEETR